MMDIHVNAGDLLAATQRTRSAATVTPLRRSASLVAAGAALLLTAGCAGPVDGPTGGAAGRTSGDGTDIAVGDRLSDLPDEAWPLVPETVQVVDDGRTVTATCGGRVCRWPTVGGESGREGYAGDALAAEAGVALVTAGLQVLTVDTASGEVVGVLDEDEPPGDSAPLTGGVALSEDGSLGTSSGADDRVWAWPTDDPAAARELDLPEGDAVGAPVPDPDGGLVAVGTTTGQTGEADEVVATVVVVDAASGEPVAEPEGLADPLAWSPDGSLLVGRDAEGVLGAWRTDDWTLEASSDARASRTVAVSDDGLVAYVDAADDAGTTVQLWSPGTPYRIARLRTDHPDPIGGLAWTPDGRLVSASSEATAEGGPTPEDPRDEVQVRDPDRPDAVVRQRLPEGR